MFHEDDLIMPCSASIALAKVTQSCVLLVQPSNGTSQDHTAFLGGWTWAAVIGPLTLVIIAAVGWRKRGFDKTATQLQPLYERVRAVEAEIDALEAKSVLVRDDCATLTKLKSELRDDARRWQKCPLEGIDDLIEKYAAALLEDRARRLLPWGVDKKVNLVLRRRDTAEELRRRLASVKEWIEARLKR
ncbi:hypothetical protein [Streptomyces sp. NPDC001401]|uniref:hypothetical protein n=1 Tax=Streptomyces sp. NPDC001401 TaxID=3364570 RepID=UPI0036CAD93C